MKREELENVTLERDWKITEILFYEWDEKRQRFIDNKHDIEQIIVSKFFADVNEKLTTVVWVTPEILRDGKDFVIGIINTQTKQIEESLKGN